ncbi:DUF461 domain-containing protein [Streptomyces sp. SAJ15]|uniref:DUF461 domain-containing protein n=1 Tax=Streptomyces sp. SAJ15 TaxID=2011095 RepID=UPI001185D14A|nr:DUF461 domain-containing protein [Streptomyces sp. SAJ15]TVL88016.1 DUF461 domain-containing protein [Streptomyces sp. SAJ15]
MSSDLRRGALAATALVLSIAPLSACAAGNDAQTLEIKPDNAATSVGGIKLQNATLITQPDLKGHGPAVISVKIFNNGQRDQTLEGIAVKGADEPVKLTPAKGSGKLVVPANGSLTLGGKDNASAVIPSGREAVKDGDAQTMTFDFSETGKVSLDAFVVPATSYFDKWGPEKPPTAPKPQTPAKPGTPTGETTPGAPTGSPTGTPAGTQNPKNPEQPGAETNKPGGAATTPGGAVAPGEPDPNGAHAGH